MKAICLLIALLVAVEARVQRDPNYGLTPGGYRHKSCCHHVPSGSTVVEDEHGIITVRPLNADAYLLPKCRYPRLSRVSPKSENGSKPGEVEGWHVYTKQNVGGNLNAFLGQWNVPDVPQGDDDQTIFMFTGLQNIDWVPPNPGPNSAFDIIQPVLQYGPSEAGGGSYWTLASWYVPLQGDSAVWSDLINVNAGDNIFGNMTLVSSANWYINSLDTTSNQKTDMTISRPRLKTQPWAYVTLEVYDLYECDDYPTQPVNFNNLQLFVSGKQQQFQWQAIQADPSCNQLVTINSPSNVTISW